MIRFSSTGIRIAQKHSISIVWFFLMIPNKLDFHHQIFDSSFISGKYKYLYAFVALKVVV
jgi:hypothetical protein